MPQNILVFFKITCLVLLTIGRPCSKSAPDAVLCFCRCLQKRNSRYQEEQQQLSVKSHISVHAASVLRRQSYGNMCHQSNFSDS